MRPSPIVLIAGAFLSASGSAWAQAPTSRDSVKEAKPLFTYRDAVLAASFTGLTVAMFPVDKSIARRLQNPSVQGNRFFANGATDLRLVADPGGLIVGLSAYGVGRVARWQNVADLGLHTVEALSVAGLATTVLDGLVARARPFVVGDSNSTDFHFGHGFGNHNRQSFPSGHATSGFAFASTFTSESARWWPHATWMVGPLMYGAATLSGFSRMYDDRHWASDIIFGAAIGTFAGIKVVRYNHGSHPSNLIDRFFLGSTVAVGPHGDTQVGFSSPF